MTHHSKYFFTPIPFFDRGKEILMRSQCCGVCVCVCVCARAPFQLFSYLTSFHQTWYKHYFTEAHAYITVNNFLYQ